MDASAISRTQEQALKMLQDQIDQNSDRDDDTVLASKLAGNCIEQILELEWVHQFDEDRSGIVSSIREIVELAIDEHMLENRKS